MRADDEIDLVLVDLAFGDIEGKSRITPVVGNGKFHRDSHEAAGSIQLMNTDLDGL